MLPILLTIGSIKIYTFGVFLVLAFFWGTFFLWRLIRLTAYKEEEIFDGLFLSLFSAIFFSRLFYVIANFSEFGFNPLKFILINGYPGFSLNGVFLGGIIFSYLYFFFKKKDFLDLFNYFATSIFLSLGFGFLGIFFASKSTFPSLFLSMVSFISAFLSYQVLMNYRKGIINKNFNFIFFILIISLINLITSSGLSQKLFLISVLTGGGYVLYYFRITILKRITSFFLTVKKYGKKIFSKGVRRDKK